MGMPYQDDYSNWFKDGAYVFRIIAAYEIGTFGAYKVPHISENILDSNLILDGEHV
jgi:hypothetical protein